MTAWSSSAALPGSSTTRYPQRCNDAVDGNLYRREWLVSSRAGRVTLTTPHP